jgi:maleate cis-trans isomerase
MPFNFKLIKPDFFKANLGLIVLKSDETIEHEFRSILDPEVVLTAFTNTVSPSSDA